MIIETDDFSNIKFIVKREYPKLSPKIQKEVDKHWTTLTKKNRYVFNGNLFGVHNIYKTSKSESNKYEITLCKTDYKLASYIEATGNNIIGGLMVGITAMIYEKSSDTYVFFKRSSKIVYCPNKIGMVGGGFDYTDKNNIPEEMQKIIKKEISEEIIIKENVKDTNLRPRLIWIDNKTLSTVVVFTMTAEVLNVANWENSEVVRIPKKNFSEYIKANKEDFFMKTIEDISYLF